MAKSQASEVAIAVNAENSVSGLLLVPKGACACFVMAHGAGAGMVHPFLSQMAEGLAGRGVATLRYQFPYMERGARRPDPPKLAHAAVRAAVARAAELTPGLPLIAGGKSFGARMTSQAQAAAPLPAVCGLAFLGFPLHPAGRPSEERTGHLSEVGVPMLFLQGSRDALADLRVLQPVVRHLGARATLAVIEDADHSFRVPAGSGRKDAEVRGLLLDALTAWIDRVITKMP